MANFNKNLYSKPSLAPAQVGKFQGIGIPAKHGTRPGSFHKRPNPELRVPKAVPPLKFN